jgi:hypothetical protein
VYEPKTKDSVKTALKRWRIASDAEAEWRKRAVEDLKFRDGEQWPKRIVDEREADDRPCLVLDRTNQFIHQVTNEIRQNKPAPRVSPVDDKGDIEIGEIFQGILRHIYRQSKADAVRSYAAEYSVSVGKGYYRIITDYESEDSFDQEVYIKRIKNPLSVFMDPSCQEPDYSDAKWALIVEDVPREEYEQRYPDSEMAGLPDAGGIGANAPEWAQQDDSVRIAEYFWLEYEEKTLVLLADSEGNPKAVWEDEVQPYIEVGFTAVVDKDGEPRTRKSKVCTVRWQLINSVEVLEEREWPGKYIPIVTMLGEEMDIDGKTSLKGMVAALKSAQQEFNYERSALVEAIALAPKAPYIYAMGQIQGVEDQWQQANRRNLAVLPYNPITIGGHVMPPPTRQLAEPAIQAITVAVQLATEDLKASVGIYDASIGNRSNETSGKAILARETQSDTATYHYIDNINLAINHEARILLDLIPKVYDRPGRVARIIGEDETEKTVVLNAPTKAKGIEKIYDLSSGRYDVAVTIAASYSTKRQEAAEAMLELARNMPVVGTHGPDLVVRNLDIPGAQELADRLKKALPPGLADDEENPIPPQAQAQMQQMDQMIQMLTQQVEGLTREQETDQIQIDSKERIELAKLQLAHEELQVKKEEILGKLTIEQLKLQQGASIEQLWAELDVIKHQLGLQEAAVEREQASIESDKDREFQREQTDVQAAVGVNEADKDRHLTREQQSAQAQEADKTREFQAEQSDADRQHQTEQAKFAAKNKPAPSKK